MCSSSCNLFQLIFLFGFDIPLMRIESSYFPLQECRFIQLVYFTIKRVLFSFFLPSHIICLFVFVIQFVFQPWTRVKTTPQSGDHNNKQQTNVCTHALAVLSLSCLCLHASHWRSFNFSSLPAFPNPLSSPYCPIILTCDSGFASTRVHKPHSQCFCFDSAGLLFGHRKTKIPTTTKSVVVILLSDEPVSADRPGSTLWACAYARAYIVYNRRPTSSAENQPQMNA